METPQHILNQLKRGAIDVIGESDLLLRLRERRPLRIKLGCDPTAPDIHLGHTVLLNKLRQFQELGHKVLFLIGDFTAKIGDPSGRDVTRAPLSQATISENANTYQKQALQILDPEHTQIVFNSTWMKQQSAADIIKLAATYTVARMLQRDDFQKRYKAQHPIAMHEFLYPLLQAYDSVMIQSDVELGGTDQTFNLLVGRELQKHFDQKPQCILTMPLLEGLDGVQKMSKSLNNYIGISDTPDNMFGKLMSISDHLMWRYYELLNVCSVQKIRKMQHSVREGKNPRDLKINLAKKIVTRFYDKTVAEEVCRNFIEYFRECKLPKDITERELRTERQDGNLEIAYLLKQAGLVKSTSEALRTIKQGAVRIDGQRIKNEKLLIQKGASHIYQVGKRRFAKIKVI